MSGFRHFTVNSPFPFSMPIHLHVGIFREAGPSVTGNPTHGDAICCAGHIRLWSWIYLAAPRYEPSKPATTDTNTLVHRRTTGRRWFVSYSIPLHIVQDVLDPVTYAWPARDRIGEATGGTTERRGAVIGTRDTR